MRRTALMAIIALLLAVGTAQGTEVYWTPAPELLPQAHPFPAMPTWGDLGSDGDDDLANATLALWRDGSCPGLPTWRSEYGVLPAPADCQFCQTALGDLDADGDLDVIYGCFQSPYLHVFWNVGTPQVPEWEEDSSSVQGLGYYFSSPFLADLDDDGDLDMLIVATTGNAGLYENTGTPQLPAWASAGLIDGVALGTSSPRAVLADLDGDRDLDLVGAAFNAPVKCWENVGAQQAYQFVRNQGMLTGVDQCSTGTYVLALPDVDCDGDPDLLLQRASDLAVLLYLNDSITPVVPASWGTIKALYR